MGGIALASTPSEDYNPVSASAQRRREGIHGMGKTFKLLVVLLGVFVLTCFSLFLIDLTAQVVHLASVLHPRAGSVTLWSLLALYTFCGAVPVAMLFTLQKPLVPPQVADGPEFEHFLRQLAKRLSSNPLLKGHSLTNRDEIEKAIAIIDEQVDQRISAAAGEVFIGTAISQVGKLDTLIVLSAQCKMIWEVARSYNQRPSVPELVYLYSNVAGTAFFAGELDDVDLAEHLQPLVSTTLGSVAGGIPAAIPGLQLASSVVINSIFDGAANAFLTLRVGVIAKGYCRALVKPDRKLLRRAAVLSATALIGGIVLAGSKRVTSALWDKSKAAAGSALTGAAEGASNAARGFSSKVKSAGSSLASWVQPSAKSETNQDGTPI